MTKRYKVLISAPYLVKDIELFRDELAENGVDIDVRAVNERLEESELLEIIAQYDGVVCGDDRFTPKVYDRAENLKVVVKWGTGIDSLNREYALSKNIPVLNTPDAFTEPVSDSVMAFILSFARQIATSDRLMKNGHWQKCAGFCLNELTLGIIGVGRIGSAVAKKANAFGMKILGCDIKDIDPEVVKVSNIEMVTKDELLQRSDYLTLNCDLNPTSFHLIGEDDFNIMKKSAVIINTARGPIVDEQSLIHALQSRKISGAGLDVFEQEPLCYDSPLRKMDNCLLSSHNVNTSPKYWSRVHRNSIDMLYQGLNIEMVSL